jgi:hypothetical protein
MSRIAKIRMTKGVMGELSRRAGIERPINVEIIQVGRLVRETGRRLVAEDLEPSAFAKEEPI